MPILCSLIGHKYGEETIEERKEEQKGKTAIIKISKKVCTRCQDIKENRMNTTITDQESGDGSNSKNTSSKDETKDRKRDVNSDTAGTTESKDIFRSTGYSSVEKGMVEGEPDGGVILESNNETTNSGSEDSSKKSTLGNDSTGHQNHITSDDDEGVHRLNQDNKDEEQKTTEFRIICESCTFSKVQTVTSRRSGDLCPKCGSWLEVKELKDTDTSEL